MRCLSIRVLPCITGFIRGILRGVRYAKSLRVLFSHRRSPSWTTLVLYSRVVFFFNEPSTCVTVEPVYSACTVNQSLIKWKVQRIPVLSCPSFLSVMKLQSEFVLLNCVCCRYLFIHRMHIQLSVLYNVYCSCPLSRARICKQGPGIDFQPGAESIPRLLKRLQNTGSVHTRKISVVNIANQWGENQQTLPSPIVLL